MHHRILDLNSDEVSTVFDEMYHNIIASKANQWSGVLMLILQYFQSGIS